MGVVKINPWIVLFSGVHGQMANSRELSTFEGPAVVSINLFVRSIATISDIKMVSPVLRTRANSTPGTY